MRDDFRTRASRSALRTIQTETAALEKLAEAVAELPLRDAFEAVAALIADATASLVCRERLYHGLTRAFVPPPDDGSARLDSAATQMDTHPKQS